MWAWAVVTTRAFAPAILVPLQDMVNHKDGMLTQYGVELPRQQPVVGSNAAPGLEHGGFINLYAAANFSTGSEVLQSYHNAAKDDDALADGGHDLGFGTGARTYDGAEQGSRDRPPAQSGCHFLMHYGFLANERVEVALPSPAVAVGLLERPAKGLTMAAPTTSHEFRSSLLRHLDLPHDKLQRREEGGGRSASEGADSSNLIIGAAQKPLEDTHPMAQNAGIVPDSVTGLGAFSLIEVDATATTRGSGGAIAPSSEANVLCTLRIRLAAIEVRHPYHGAKGTAIARCAATLVRSARTVC